MARVEIKNEKDLERWLNSLPEEQRRQVAIAIACRAALRVVPELGIKIPQEEQRATDSILYVFRAIATSLVTVSKASRDTELEKKTRLARFSGTIRAGEAVRTALNAIDAAVDAAAATTSAVAAVRAAARAAGNAAAFAAARAARAIDTKDTKRAVVEGVAAVFIASTTTWEAIDADVDAFVNGKSITDLLNAPLWLTGTPDWAQELWTSMKRRLLAREDEHWEVWTNWYDARLDPSRHIPCYSPPVPELERARVLLPDDLWEQGPAAVNAEIKRLIEEHKCSKEIDPPPPPPEDEQPEVPEQAPATIMPVWDGDRLVLPSAPVDAEGLDRELLADTLRAMREQLFALAEKLQMDQSSNAIDPRIVEALRDTAKLIPESGEIPRHRLIRMAEEVEELETYLTDPYNEEREAWPDILRTKATKLIQNLSRLLDKFRPWREAHQHLQEEAAKVDEQTLESLPEEAEAFAEELQELFEPEKLDPRIPQLLREMGQRLGELRDAIQRRGEAAFQRAADLVESIGNILKRIASRVLKWPAEKAMNFAKHLDKAIDKELEQFAQFLARMGRRLVQGGVGGGLIGGGGYLAHKFGWLAHIIEWLHSHFPWLLG